MHLTRKTMFKLDKETLDIMRIFKTLMNKQEISNILAKETVHKGLKTRDKVFCHYYGENEPADVTVACISFGLMQLMEEDFYIVKTVLGYDFVMKLLKAQERYLSII